MRGKLLTRATGKVVEKFHLPNGWENEEPQGKFRMKETESWNYNKLFCSLVALLDDICFHPMKASYKGSTQKATAEASLCTTESMREKHKNTKYCRGKMI